MNNYDHANNLSHEEDAKLQRSYNEYFDNVKPSEELITAALSHTSHASSQKTPRKKSFLPYAAAACLALAIVGISAYGLVINQQDASQNSTQTAVSDETANDSGTSLAWPAFTVQAFAEETQSLLTPIENGTIVFSHQDDALFLGTDYEMSGFYTGCIFTVNADDAVRIQAHVSNGMLYQYTSETLSSADNANAEKLAEAKSWKPLVRGKGDYYGGYDLVSVLSNDTMGDVYTVGASKRLGQTVDLDMPSNQPPYLGLWVDGTSIGDGSPSFDALIESFEGQSLTVTLTYTDGHSATETLELHVINESDSSLASLGATLVDQSSDDFPYVDEPTNEYIDKVTAAETLNRLNDWGEPTDNVTIADGDEVTLPDFSVGNISATTSKALPDGLTLVNTDISNMGDLDYWNMICSQTNGFTVDENGTPSEGWSILSVNFTLKNTSGSAQEFYPLGQVQLGKSEGDAYLWLMGGARSYYWIASLSNGGETNATLNSSGASANSEFCSPSSILNLESHATAEVTVAYLVKDSCIGEDGFGVLFSENENSNYFVVL